MNGSLSSMLLVVLLGAAWLGSARIAAAAVNAQLDAYTMELLTRKLDHSTPLFGVSFLEWRLRPIEGLVDFRLSARGSVWLGFALAGSRSMLNTPPYLAGSGPAIIAQPSTGVVAQHLLRGRSVGEIIRLPDAQQTITDAAVAVVDGRTIMAFTRSIEVPPQADPSERRIDVRGTGIIFAVGNQDALSYHGSTHGFVRLSLDGGLAGACTRAGTCSGHGECQKWGVLDDASAGCVCDVGFTTGASGVCASCDAPAFLPTTGADGATVCTLDASNRDKIYALTTIAADFDFVKDYSANPDAFVARFRSDLLQTIGVAPSRVRISQVREGPTPGIVFRLALAPPITNAATEEDAVGVDEVARRLLAQVGNPESPLMLGDFSGRVLSLTKFSFSIEAGSGAGGAGSGSSGGGSAAGGSSGGKPAAGASPTAAPRRGEVSLGRAAAGHPLLQLRWLILPRDNTSVTIAMEVESYDPSSWFAVGFNDKHAMVGSDVVIFQPALVDAVRNARDPTVGTGVSHAVITETSMEGIKQVTRPPADGTSATAVDAAIITTRRRARRAAVNGDGMLTLGGEGVSPAEAPYLGDVTVDITSYSATVKYTIVEPLVPGGGGGASSYAGRQSLHLAGGGEAVNVVYASGSSGKGKLAAHLLSLAGARRVNLAAASVVDASAALRPLRPAVIAHGALAFVGLLLLAPAGVAAARYGKKLLGSSSSILDRLVGKTSLAGAGAMRSARWFQLHRGIQAAATLIASAGVITGLAVTPLHFTDTHHYLGIVTAVALWVQFGLGLLRPHAAPAGSPVPLTRRVWAGVHRGLGLTVLVLAVPTAVYGMCLTQAPRSIYIPFAVTVGLVIAVLAAAEVTLAARSRIAAKAKARALAAGTGVTQLQMHTPLQQRLPSPAGNGAGGCVSPLKKGGGSPAAPHGLRLPRTHRWHSNTESLSGAALQGPGPLVVEGASGVSPASAASVPRPGAQLTPTLDSLRGSAPCGAAWHIRTPSDGAAQRRGAETAGTLPLGSPGLGVVDLSGLVLPPPPPAASAGSRKLPTFIVLPSSSSTVRVRRTPSHNLSHHLDAASLRLAAGSPVAISSPAVLQPPTPQSTGFLMRSLDASPRHSAYSALSIGMPAPQPAQALSATTELDASPQPEGAGGGGLPDHAGTGITAPSLLISKSEPVASGGPNPSSSSSSDGSPVSLAFTSLKAPAVMRVSSPTMAALIAAANAAPAPAPSPRPPSPRPPRCPTPPPAARLSRSSNGSMTSAHDADDGTGSGGAGDAQQAQHRGVALSGTRRASTPRASDGSGSSGPVMTLASRRGAAAHTLTLLICALVAALVVLPHPATATRQSASIYAGVRLSWEVVQADGTPRPAGTNPAPDDALDFQLTGHGKVWLAFAFSGGQRLMLSSSIAPGGTGPCLLGSFHPATGAPLIDETLIKTYDVNGFASVPSSKRSFSNVSLTYDAGTDVTTLAFRRRLQPPTPGAWDSTAASLPIDAAATFHVTIASGTSGELAYHGRGGKTELTLCLLQHSSSGGGGGGGASGGSGGTVPTATPLPCSRNGLCGGHGECLELGTETTCLCDVGYSSSMVPMPLGQPQCNQCGEGLRSVPAPPGTGSSFICVEDPAFLGAITASTTVSFINDLTHYRGLDWVGTMKPATPAADAGGEADPAVPAEVVDALRRVRNQLQYELEATLGPSSVGRVQVQSVQGDDSSYTLMANASHQAIPLTAQVVFLPPPNVASLSSVLAAYGAEVPAASEGEGTDTQQLQRRRLAASLPTSMQQLLAQQRGDAASDATVLPPRDLSRVGAVTLMQWFVSQLRDPASELRGGGAGAGRRLLTAMLAQPVVMLMDADGALTAPPGPRQVQASAAPPAPRLFADASFSLVDVLLDVDADVAYPHKAQLQSGLLLRWGIYNDATLVGRLTFAQGGTAASAGGAPVWPWVAVGINTQRSMHGTDAIVLQPGDGPSPTTALRQYVAYGRLISQVVPVPAPLSTLTSRSFEARLHPAGGTVITVYFQRSLLVAQGVVGANSSTPASFNGLLSIPGGLLPRNLYLTYAFGQPGEVTMAAHSTADRGLGVINFATGWYEPVSTASGPAVVAHGVLMALAYGLFIPLGVLMARYYKGYLPASRGGLTHPQPQPSGLSSQQRSPSAAVVSIAKSPPAKAAAATPSSVAGRPTQLSSPAKATSSTLRLPSPSVTRSPVSAGGTGVAGGCAQPSQQPAEPLPASLLLPQPHAPTVPGAAATCHGAPSWFDMHRVFQGLGLAAVIAATAVSIAITPAGLHFKGAHRATGLASSLLVVAQFLGGMCRPPLPVSTAHGKRAPLSRKRRVWEVAHRVGGAAAFVLGVIAVYMGFYHAASNLLWPALFSLMLGWTLALGVAHEVARRKCARRAWGRLCGHGAA